MKRRRPRKRPYRPYWKLPDAVRREIIRLAARGGTHRTIAAEVGMSTATVSRVLAPMGWVMRSDAWRPSDSRLSIDQRVEIRLGLERGESLRSIGARIGRAASTICREVSANGGRVRYRPMVAHRRAQALAKRPKPTKLSCNRALRDRVTADLLEFWSPQQIARRLHEDFGDDGSMQISHETIYKSLYVQGRGGLRRELARCLRTGRARRRPRGRAERRGRIPDIVLISERPPEVEDRAVPGHWEGDLLMGKDGRSAIGTLVERSTRYVMLLHLPKGFTAAEVRNAMVRTIKTLPESLRRSVTWDQGREMAYHTQFSVDTGVQVYFCDPHSPWQRGSNENTNGLLRQYFPKGTDLSVHGPARLRKVAASLNGRPRETLDWRTPAEKFAELVATAD